jgi:hypothetical protein
MARERNLEVCLTELGARHCILVPCWQTSLSNEVPCKATDQQGQHHLAAVLEMQIRSVVAHAYNPKLR